MSADRTDPQPLRFPPLDKGDKVGITTILENEDVSHTTELYEVMGSDVDIVCVAVPAGKGLILETWLKLTLGVEETPPSGREDSP